MSFYQEARARARRRRSPWNLLLIPAVVVPLGLLWWGLVALFEFLHASLYSAQDLRITPNGIGPILSAVAPFLAALPLSMMVGNRLVRLVRPARQALDQEAKPLPITSFSNAQQQLLWASKLLVPISLGLALFGALLPWHR